MSTIWMPGSDPTRIAVTLDPRTFQLDGIAVHGNTPFSCPVISQIDDTLWVGGCINGLRLPDEIRHVVSLYPWEQYRAHDDVYSVLSVVMYDSEGEIDSACVHRIARWVNECRADAPTLVHCQAGLNRSNLITATALVLSGMMPATAIALLREKRSPAVLCNRNFEDWVMEQAE